MSPMKRSTLNRVLHPRLWWWRRPVVCVGFVLFGLSSGAAQAQVITEFNADITPSSAPYGITAGPDGNLWFTEIFDRIGRITPFGVVTEFSAGITSCAQPHGITAGPDGNLWFTENCSSRIARITPLGVVTEFSAGITPSAFPEGITAGPDGNLWFTESIGNQIGRITPLGIVTEFGAGITPSSLPRGITAGPDGNLWFTEGFDRIGRITPLGVVTEFSAGITAGASLQGITAGPDGNLWFAEANGNQIGRITPLGVVTEFTGITAGAAPWGITVGPDGNLWFAEANGNQIGRITPLGVITEFSAGITPGAETLDITAGSDGNLWFTEFDGNRIGRITVGAVAPAPPTIAKSFGTARIALNGSTSLSFTISNPNASTALTGVGFTDTLPFLLVPFGWPTPALVVSIPNGLIGTCPGETITAPAGFSSIGLTGVTLAAGASCTFSVNVTGRVLGTQNNVTGAVTSVEGGASEASGRASASVTVVSGVPGFYTLTPCRVLDTREPSDGPSLQPGATRTFDVAASPCGIPATAKAISVNLAVTGPVGPGYLTLFPGDAVQAPLTSTINFSANQTRANNAVLPLASDGSGTINVLAGTGGTVDFILDVNGYFQ